VLLSLEEYTEIISKAKKMESLLERIEESLLLKEAKRVAEGYNPQEAYSIHDVLTELEITEQDIDELEDSVVIE